MPPWAWGTFALTDGGRKQLVVLYSEGETREASDGERRVICSFRWKAAFKPYRL